MTLKEALKLCREIEEARNLAYTKHQIRWRGKTIPFGQNRWENDWPHNCRATTTDGEDFLVGFNVNVIGNDGGVFSNFREVDCKDDWLKQYGHLYPDIRRS